MGVNSLPKTVTRERRDCDLNPGRSAPESSTLTTRLPSHSDMHSVVECNLITDKFTWLLQVAPSDERYGGSRRLGRK